jgi:multidrug efflux pump subunit AcrA (membrane-fusion protein)
MAKNIFSLTLVAWLGLGATLAQAQQYGDTYPVQSRRIGTSVSLGGTVVPYKEVTLAAQLPGRIDYLAGEEGDRYEKGALLAKINDDELHAQRRSAIAELANAETALRTATVQYSREFWAPNSISKSPGGMGLPSMFDQFFTKPMSSFAGISKPGLERRADLYNQGAAIEQARNAILRVQSQIQAIDAKLRDARSYAPFDGVIVQKFVEVGDTVQPGQPLYKFADIQYLQIRVDVPARLMPGISKGQILPARLDVGDAMVQVRVAQIFPMADPQRHTVTVKFDLPIGAPAAPGMYANVMIPDTNAPKRDLVVVPRSSLVWRGSLPAVYVVDNEGGKELRLVRIGDRVDREHVMVLSGLRPGERILTHPPGAGDRGFDPAPPGSLSAPR